MARNSKLMDAQDDSTGAFPVPFPREEFQKDLVEVLFFYARTVALLFGEKAGWRVLGMDSHTDSTDITSPDISAAEQGVTFDQIRKTDFAQAMVRLYEFAFYGRWDASAESMDPQSYYMWVTDFSFDAAHGPVANQWDYYGMNIHSHASHCVVVCETANARHILEGGEPLRSMSGAFPEQESGVLTIRQMALLAGMEEMSIRAASNPKRAYPLTKIDDDGPTRIAVDVAKAWLKAKGRYIKRTLYSGKGELDLSKRRFMDYWELKFALFTRCAVAADRIGLAEMNHKLKPLGLEFVTEFGEQKLTIENAHFSDEGLISGLADILGLPSDLLVLRCKEVVAKEQLLAVERQLDVAIQKQQSSN